MTDFNSEKRGSNLAVAGNMHTLNPFQTNTAPFGHLIAAQAAVLCGVTYRDLISASRTKPISEARFAAIWTAKQHLGYTSSRLAKLVGYKDTTSAIYALQQANNLRADNPEFAELTDYLLEQAELRSAEQSARRAAQVQ